MRKGKFIRVLEKCELRNEKGVAVQLQDYASAIKEAVQEAIPDWGVEVYDDHIIFDNAGSEGFNLIKEAFAKHHALANLNLTHITILFCDTDGNPICGRERFYELAAAENQTFYSISAMPKEFSLFHNIQHSLIRCQISEILNFFL